MPTSQPTNGTAPIRPTRYHMNESRNGPNRTGTKITKGFQPVLFLSLWLSSLKNVHTATRSSQFTVQMNPNVHTPEASALDHCYPTFFVSNNDKIAKRLQVLSDISNIRHTPQPRSKVLPECFPQQTHEGWAHEAHRG